MRAGARTVVGSKRSGYEPLVPWSLRRDGSVLHIHLEAPMTSPEWNGLLKAVRVTLPDPPKAVTLPAEVEGFGPVDTGLLWSLWEALTSAGITIQRG